jgi:benzoyl-CoA reductase/2-hydroxyglutaryl-CoA dehydratase subunit BcrC/BadD/HgdB
MEDVFESRIRSIFDGLASGAWPFLNLVVIPRTSEQEHKLFLYLHEIVRQQLTKSVPEVILYNLLHARSPEAEEYGLGRTEDLVRHLERNIGHRIEPATLAAAIEEANAARQAIRQLLALRHGTQPRLTGTEALKLIGAQYFMDRAQYAKLATEAAIELSQRNPLKGARILVKGAPLHHTGLHASLEQHEAVVVAEDDWWGSRSLSNDIPLEGDLIRAIFKSYYLDAPSPRVFPLATADEWFSAAVQQVDAVVFYLPPEDTVWGWDYPRQQQMLQQRGIPSLLVREDATATLAPEWHGKVEEFLSQFAAIAE